MIEDEFEYEKEKFIKSRFTVIEEGKYGDRRWAILEGTLAVCVYITKSDKQPTTLTNKVVLVESFSNSYPIYDNGSDKFFVPTRTAIQKKDDIIDIVNEFEAGH